MSGCLIAGLAGAGWADTAPRKKLIEFGWDKPSPEQRRDNLAQYEPLTLDDLSVRLTVGNEIFTKQAFPDAGFESARGVLADLKFTNLTDNFLVIWGTAQDGWLWTSDADWQAAETDIRNFAVRMRRHTGAGAERLPV